MSRMITRKTSLWFPAAILCLFLSIPEVTCSVHCKCHIGNSDITTIGITCENGPSGSPVCSKFVRASIPSGYRYIPSLGLYKLHVLGKSYNSAQKACAKEGARLVIPQNEAMADALVKLFSSDDAVSSTYVGINDLSSPGFYQGSDEQLAPWLNWEDGEPNNAGGKEHCVTFDKIKLMNDVPCDMTKPFICERRLKAPIPQGYQFLDGQGFYKAYTDKKSFKDAEDQCRGDGAHLAVPETLTEAEALMRLVKTNGKLGSVWIGITDEVTEGRFLTIHGTSLEDLEYANWEDEEPNNDSGNEDCVAFLKSGAINDDDCAEKHKFVCEYDAYSTN